MRVGGHKRPVRVKHEQDRDSGGHMPAAEEEIENAATGSLDAWITELAAGLGVDVTD
jgi:hypothetical protein